MKINYTIGSNVLKKNVNDFYLELLCADENEIISEIKRLKGNKLKVHAISTETTIDILDRCAKLWLNKEYSRPHIEIISRITNQSTELVTKELEDSMGMLLRENIEKTIIEELGDFNILDEWIPTSYGHVHRQPRGLTFHNISGNAFVVAPVSISMGLLSKNCNLVKVSGDEPYFAHAFYESLCEVDESIKDRLSVLYFDSSNSNIYETIISHSDCVIHWGGEHSGRVMSDLCSKYQTHLIMHGAKISFEVIDKTDNIAKTAELVASDIIFWEQKACLSPRIVFINQALDFENFSFKVKEALVKLNDIFPKTYFTPWNSIKTIQDRQYCLLKYGKNSEKNTKVYSSYNADYTVILNDTMPDKEDIDRFFYRFIYISPYKDKAEVYNYIEENISSYLQTMGYSGTDKDFIEKMTLLGISIVTKPGEMPLRHPGTSHDGINNLKELTYPVSEQL